MHLQFKLLPVHALHGADDEAVLVFPELIIAAGAHDGGILMAGAGRGEFAGGDLQNAEPDRDEHILLVVGTNGVVGGGQDIGRGAAQHGAVLQDDL